MGKKKVICNKAKPLDKCLTETRRPPPPPSCKKKKKKKVSRGLRPGEEPAVRGRYHQKEAVPRSSPGGCLLCSSSVDVRHKPVHKTTYKCIGKFLDGHPNLKGSDIFFFSKSFHVPYVAEGSTDLKTTPPWPCGDGEALLTPWQSKAPARVLDTPSSAADWL